MFLNEPELDISFKVMHKGKAYFIYANTGSMKCFECGDIGHKRHTCPHKAQVTEVEVRPSTSADNESIGQFLRTCSLKLNHRGTTRLME